MVIVERRHRIVAPGIVHLIGNAADLFKAQRPVADIVAGRTHWGNYVVTQHQARETCRRRWAAGISKLMLCAETGVAKLPLVLRSWLEIALMVKRHLSS